MNQLAYNANKMRKSEKNNAFGLLIDQSIDRAKLKKKDVAEEAQIHPTSLSRIISGEMGSARDTAIAIVNAINKIANREVVNLSEALNLAGYAQKKTAKEPQNKIEELAFHYPGIPEQKRDKVDYLIELLDNEIKKIKAEEEKYGEDGGEPSQTRREIEVDYGLKKAEVKDFDELAKNSKKKIPKMPDVQDKEKAA